MGAIISKGTIIFIVLFLVVGLSDCGNDTTLLSGLESDIDSFAPVESTALEETLTEKLPFNEPANGQEVINTETVYFYSASNNTEARVIRNLFLIPNIAYQTLDMPFHAWSTPINLRPGEQSANERWDGEPFNILSFEFENDGKAIYSIINYLASRNTNVEITFEETDRLYLQISTFDDVNTLVDSVVFVFDVFYGEWVNVTYGKLFVLTLPNEKVMELHPDQKLSDFYHDTTILFTYEPIFNIENLAVEDQFSYSIENILVVRNIIHLYDTFEPGQIMIDYVDHRRGIPSFLRYESIEGNIYTLYLYDGHVGLSFPEVFAGYIREDWEIVYDTDNSH